MGTLVLGIDGSAEAAVCDLECGRGVYVTEEPEGGSERQATECCSSCSRSR